MPLMNANRCPFSSSSGHGCMLQFDQLRLVVEEIVLRRRRRTCEGRSPPWPWPGVVAASAVSGLISASPEVARGALLTEERAQRNRAQREAAGPGEKLRRVMRVRVRSEGSWEQSRGGSTVQLFMSTPSRFRSTLATTVHAANSAGSAPAGSGCVSLVESLRAGSGFPR